MTNMAKTEHIRSFLQKNAEKRSKKRSIAVHSEKNGSRCNQDTCDGKTEHVRSHFPKNVSATYNLGNLN